MTVSADEAMVSTDEALLSRDEALAATEEIHPDSTCTAEIASECMQSQVCVRVCAVPVVQLPDSPSLPRCSGVHWLQVSSSTGEKCGGSVVEGAERMDGDGELEVCTVCVCVCVHAHAPQVT